MSGLIGAAMPQFILVLPDKRCLDDFYAGLDVGWPHVLGTTRSVDNGDPLGTIGDFRSPWWPAPCGFLNDGGLSDVLGSAMWQQPYPVSGANGRLGFNGIARDAYGSPLAGALIWLIRVSTAEITAAVVADGNGAYIATTPYTDAHVIVVNGTGGTVGGASAQLLPG